MISFISNKENALAPNKTPIPPTNEEGWAQPQVNSNSGISTSAFTPTAPSSPQAALSALRKACQGWRLPNKLKNKIATCLALDKPGATPTFGLG